MTTTPDRTREERHSRLSRFFRDPRTGELAVWQSPNPALLVFVAARIASLFWDDRKDELQWIGTGALIAWALDEFVRGTSPLRRVLGAVVVSFQIFSLLG